MRLQRPLSVMGFAAALFAFGGQAQAQLLNNTTLIPTSGTNNNSRSENVDFGDIDLDGDWDMVFADGGDGGNDQNRIWINQGGVQGGTLGSYIDRTSTQFPNIVDDSRDIEFVDFEGDGDLDIYVSNTSQIQNQSNRWWTNQGLAQGGLLGRYIDETVARWVGLGGAGSSISNSLVLPTVGALPGGFTDWSCDCDFGDLDNDGDLDLFHSTYGTTFGGTVPSRIFLNDGDGLFEEFNPSGFKLLGATMPTGAAAIWCEGTFQPNTTNTTGAQADICTNTLDIDLGDIDGDLDLDILHGDRDSLTRFFHNRLEENGGSTLGFRDVSNFIYPGTNWAVNGGNYEQEMGDIDGDGDLDLYGLNWESGAGSDRMFRNNGGVFGNQTVVAGSGSDDNEGDFLDYDNDGDLDLYVANFSGGDKLYRNNDTGAGNVNFTKVLTLPTSGSSTSLDADAADIDGDGDYDVMVAQDGNQANTLKINTTNVPDTHAPYLRQLESHGNTTASNGNGRVTRVQVYDNAPYYIIWFNPTVLDISVDGCSIGSIPMISSAGQIFRGLIPSNLIGNVVYSARSQDEFGNSGSSTSDSYTASDIGGGSHLIFGSDSGASAPNIKALSVAYANRVLYVGGDNMTPGNVWLLAWNQLPLASPVVIPGIGIANISGVNFFTYTGVVDANGCGVQPIFMPPSVPSVDTYFQMFEFPGVVDLLDSSRGLRVSIQ